MTFVYPLFLWALTAVAVPVIIHLFNFRKYKKVYFTNVRFLKELKQESKSKSRLRELLILITRCLTLICLVLAFAQPVIPGKNAVSKDLTGKVHSLYIDNSFSMDNVGRQGPALALARTRARQVVSALGNNHRFQVLTNDFEGRHQRLNAPENAALLIDEIKISPAQQQLGDVLKRQTGFLAGTQAAARDLFVFSDLQKSTFNLEALKSDTSLHITIVPQVSKKINNVYLDSCWFESPLQQKGSIQKLHARVRNKSDDVIEAGSAKLMINQQQVAIASYSLQAGASRDVVFTFECRQDGFNYGSVKIEDFPVTFDDELFFAFNARVNIPVCLINGKQADGAIFSSLFADSLFTFVSFSEQTIDYAAFKTSDVILLNQVSELSSGLLAEIQKFSKRGGAVVIIPPPDIPAEKYNPGLANLGLPVFGAADTSLTRTDKIEAGSGFYAGVFEKQDKNVNLPLVNKHFRLQRSARDNFETVLRLENGHDLFGFSRLNNATVYLFAGALDGKSGNFSKHAIFVPTFYKIAFGSQSQVPPSYEVSDNVVIALKNDNAGAEEPPHIVSLADAKTDVIPEMRVVENRLMLYTRNQIQIPGFYEIRRNKISLMPLAFNYARAESDLACYTEEELRKYISDNGLKHVSVISGEENSITADVLQLSEGKKLWKLFIILTLIFITIEVALLRLLR